MTASATLQNRNRIVLSPWNLLLCRTRFAAAALVIVVAAACGGSPDSDLSQDDALTGDETGDVEALDDASDENTAPLILEYPRPGEGESGSRVVYLAPDASPSTPLGELRAQHLPVWSPDLDWGFPPEICDSAWEFDAIAGPDVFSDTSVLGDPSIAVARSVMRYEYLLSRALNDPTALRQLCVAVGSIDPARRENLLVLKSYLDSDAHRLEAPAFPDEVWVVAIGTGSAVAVACVDSSYPLALSDEGDDAEESAARLQAYRLGVARGLEDTVIDISYRVSDTAHEPVDDCRGLEDYADKWTAQVFDWISEGQLWTPTGEIIDVDTVCQPSRSSEEPDCPATWPI